MRLVELEPGDVLVIRLDRGLADPDEARRIIDAGQLLRPGERVLVLAPGVELDREPAPVAPCGLLVAPTPEGRTIAAEAHHGAPGPRSGLPREGFDVV